ncbi:MAG TPA: penicillin-binding transpeptidase domain-containing protein, partial [Motilibacterales bacterium]|nr:penicillin-binding transpeptidase domain-containing protein [Motilibacterales bacterium]
ALLLVLLLPACGSGADQEAAEGLALDLATALSAGELGALPVRGGGQEDLDAIVAGVDDIPATVTVESVEVEGDSATAALTWQWATPGGPWRYPTTAQLQKVDDQWAVRWAPTLVEPSLVAEESLDATTQRPVRGDILGAGDEPLVTLRPVMRIGIDKTKVPAEQAPESARDLAELLDIDTKAYVKAVSGAGAKAFVEALVLRDEDTSGISQAEVEEIPGAVGLADQRPLAPTRDFATEILGRVGPATAEIVEKSGGAVSPNDQVGLSGLQSRYDETLTGTPGIVVAAVADDQERRLFTTEVADGQPLRTTLDERLQKEAEEALDGVDPASAVVAVRPSTGEILAAASGAGSDGYNTSTFGQYPPGSTMKVVTALALMRAGVQPSDRVPCTSTIVVDGKTFTNYDDYPASGIGDIPLRSAVAYSCNTALISQHEQLTGVDLAEAATSLGLGVDHDLGFPAYFGQVPSPASETEKAASMIGQGAVLASPMAMAAVAASVAQGEAVVPRLLPDLAVPAADPAAPLTAEEAEALRDMMRAVVSEGTAAFLADVPGAPVGAKTGTAEFGTTNPPDTHAWMIATQGDLAVAVFVEEGQSGSQTAGPILERFLRAAG